MVFTNNFYDEIVVLEFVLLLLFGGAGHFPHYFSVLSC
jgi:hypothetical protein